MHIVAEKYANQFFFCRDERNNKNTPLWFLLPKSLTKTLLAAAEALVPPDKKRRRNQPLSNEQLQKRYKYDILAAFFRMYFILDKVRTFFFVFPRAAFRTLLSLTHLNLSH